MNWKPRQLKGAGWVKPLQVDWLKARCGKVNDGVGFSFLGEGGFVIDFKDLKKLVKEAEESRRDK